MCGRWRVPFDKDDLLIKSSYKVLEIGPGDNPTKRANVLLEKFVDSNFHRTCQLRIFPHQLLNVGDAENMPFKDNEFDYSICSHVLEHAENPATFLQELHEFLKEAILKHLVCLGSF